MLCCIQWLQCILGDLWNTPTPPEVILPGSWWLYWRDMWFYDIFTLNSHLSSVFVPDHAIHRCHMTVMASHITSNWPFFKPFLRLISKINIKASVTGTVDSPRKGSETQKNASMSIRHHGLSLDFMYHYFLYIRGEPWTLLLAENFCMWSPLLMDVNGIVIVDVNIAFLDVIYHLVCLIK